MTSSADIQALAAQIASLQAQVAILSRASQLGSSTVETAGGTLDLTATVSDAADTTAAIPGLQTSLDDNEAAVSDIDDAVDAAADAADQATQDGIAAGELAQEAADEANANAAAASQAAADATQAASDASTAAQTATDKATSAQQTADGKNAITYSTSAPNVGGTTYAWTGTEGASTSTETVNGSVTRTNLSGHPWFNDGIPGEWFIGWNSQDPNAVAIDTTTTGPHGGYSLKCTPSGAGSGLEWQPPAASGVYPSFFVKGGASLTIIGYGDSTVQFAATGDPVNGWQRYIATAAMSTSDTRFYIDIGGAQGTPFWIANTAVIADNDVYFDGDTPADPTGDVGTAAGDLWYVRSTSDGTVTAMYEWDGSTWQAHTLDSAVIASLDAGKITAGTLDAARIGAGTITGTLIAGTTIKGANIAAGTIQGQNIAGATITGDLVAAATITGSNIKAATITAANIVAGTITSNEIKAATITGGNIAAGSITASHIVSGTITSTQIAAGTITATQLSASAINGMTITGATIQTAASGRRLKLASTSMSVYDQNGTLAGNLIGYAQTSNPLIWVGSGDPLNSPATGAQPYGMLFGAQQIGSGNTAQTLGAYGDTVGAGAFYSDNYYSGDASRKVIEDTGWITATVKAGTANSSYPPAYRRINGVVYLKGRITPSANTQTLFTLPTNYRPPSPGFNFWLNRGGTDVYVTIQSNGNFIYNGPGGSGDIELIGTPCFPADN